MGIHLTRFQAMRYPQSHMFSWLTSLSVLFCCLAAPSAAQTLGWIVDRLEWIKPAERPAALEGQRVAICYLSYWDPSTPVRDALQSFVRKNGERSVKIIVVWHQVGPKMLDSLMESASPLITYARDPYDEVLLSLRRSYVVPHTLLLDRSGEVVWQGRVDSTISDILQRFAEDGVVPSDPSTPLAAYRGGTVEYTVLERTDRGDITGIGVSDQGARLWVRSKTGETAMKAIAQFLAPFADVYATDLAANAKLYDLDLIIPRGADRSRLRDSLMGVFDSVFGTISVISTNTFARSELLVIDSNDLSRFRSDRGQTLEEIALHYQRRFQTRVVLDTTCDVDQRYNVPAAFSTRERADSVLRSMGLVVLQHERSVGPMTNIVIRDASIPESSVLYHLERSHVIPTIGATIQAGENTAWYGGEVGINYGRLSSGHGFYGFYAWRSCIEVLTNSTDVVAGFNVGVDMSSIFVLRIRTGIYSDFETNTTLMFLPEIGLGYWGRYTLTLGANLPILGSNVLPSSFRLALTANLLPNGAH